MFRQFGSDLKKEFSGYNVRCFTGDLMAGLTVAAVALPLALAFGVSSGMDAATGLITAIIAGIMIGTLSGASFQISGPTGAMAAILIVLSEKYGFRGVFFAGFLSGVFLLLAAVLNFGKFVSVIPGPVITGFTSGIAIIIAFGQIDNFFGISSQGSSMIEKIVFYSKSGFVPNWGAVMFGAIVLAVMIFWPKRWSRYFPCGPKIPRCRYISIS
jgi:SulP family sulfate permease